MTTVQSVPVGRITVAPPLADKLLQASKDLPEYENRAFYSVELQQVVHDGIRAACPDGFDSLVGQIESLLAQRPYCVIVNGLRFDPGNRVFVAINRSFGDLVARPYEPPRAQLVHYIQPTTDLETTHNGSYETEKLHTDTADWERPVDLISMMCSRADRVGGGRSQILDVEALRQIVHSKLGSSALELLQTEPLPWQLAAYRGGGVSWRTVLSESGVCWRRYTIDLALDTLGQQLPIHMSRVLNDLERVIANTDKIVEFAMGNGDLMLLDNHRAIHARTPITDPGRSDRLMIRSWIQTS